ncbi:helix-turn-helix domain-containing protein [Candidatus Pacearchaeota archaeon]|nr:helix-turn-helix domain-containing protein [Candidatus Pacearchaeota archaeon]
MNNKMLHPQEIEVWYIIPSIRREIAIEMKNKGISQKKIAEFLGVSEPAISQYFAHKRAKDISLGYKIKKEVVISVNAIITDNSVVLYEIQRLIDLNETKNIICQIHRKQSNIYKNCKICFENEKHIS